MPDEKVALHGCVIRPSREDFENYARAHRYARAYRPDLNIKDEDKELIELAPGSFLDYIRRTKGAEVGLQAGQPIPETQRIEVVMDFAELKGADLSDGVFVGVTIENPAAAVHVTLTGAYFGPKLFEELQKQPGLIKKLYLLTELPELLSTEEAILKSLSSRRHTRAQPSRKTPPASVAPVRRGWFGAARQVVGAVVEGVRDVVAPPSFDLFKWKDVIGWLSTEDGRSKLSAAMKGQDEFAILWNDRASKRALGAFITNVAQEFAKQVSLGLRGSPPANIESILKTAVEASLPALRQVCEVRATAGQVAGRKLEIAERDRADKQPPISDYPAPSFYGPEDGQKIKKRELELKRKAILLAVMVGTTGAAAAANPFIDGIPGLSWVSKMATSAVTGTAAVKAITTIRNALSSKVGDIQAGLSGAFTTEADKITDFSKAIPDWVVTAAEKALGGSDRLLEMGAVAAAVEGHLSIAYTAYKASEQTEAFQGLIGITARTALEIPMMFALAAAVNDTHAVWTEIKAQKAKPFFERLSPANKDFQKRIDAKMFKKRIGRGLAIGLAAVAVTTLLPLAFGLNLFPGIAATVTTHWLATGICGIPAVLGLSALGEYMSPRVWKFYGESQRLLKAMPALPRTPREAIYTAKHVVRGAARAGASHVRKLGRTPAASHADRLRTSISDKSDRAKT